VLAWILTRTTGRTLAQLTSERIWSRLGAERDAFYTVDGIGTAWGGGGLGQIAVRGSDEADIRAKRPRATGRLGRG
jgi:CubicO group peptidase (beta-lactamase class C family)